MLLGLFVIYPMAQHSWSGIVLCIGSDGHVELEDGRASDCATEVGKAAAESHYDHVIAEIELQEFEDCGPCIDIALLTSPFDGQRASKVEVSASPNITPQITHQSFYQDNARVISHVPSSSIITDTPFFSPLSTIALLI